MTLPMLEALRSEIARVDLSLTSVRGTSKTGIEGGKEGREPLRSGEFLALTAKVTNLYCKFYPSSNHHIFPSILN